MIDVEEYQRLKKKVESLKAEADRAEGVLQSQERRLKDEFGCDSIEEAEELLEKLNKEEEELEKKYSEALEEFQTKWGEKVDNGW